MTNDNRTTTADLDPVDARRDDRRNFLRKAAIGAGAAWVAPTVLATRAYAQGSQCTSLTWSALSGVSYPDVSGAPNPYVPGSPTFRSIYFTPIPASMVVGPITVNHTIINSTPALVDDTAPFAAFPAGYAWISYEAFGAATNAWMYRIQLADAVAGVPNQVTIRFDFSSPVTDLELIISDIDVATTPASWRDRVVVRGTLGNAPPVTVPFNESGRNPAFVSYTAPDTFTGIANAGNQSTDGEVTVRFNQTGNNQVDRVELTYQRASGNGSQGIAIRDLTWGICP